MRRFVAAFALVMLAAPAWAQDCRLTLSAKIALTPSTDSLLIPVQIGDAAKTLSLQLENPENAMPQAVVDALKIPTVGIANPNLVIHYGGATIHRLAHPPLMIFGGMNLKNIEFLVTPKATVAGTAGELGMKMFQSVDFELDPAHQSFNLFLPDHCPGQVVYWTQSNYARIPFTRDDLGFMTLSMTLDGQPVRARLSSDGDALVGMNAMRRIFHVDENSPGVTPVDGSAMSNWPAGTKFYSYNFKSLAGDGLSIANPKILVYGEPPKPQCQNQPADPRTSIPGMGVRSILLQDQCYGGFDVRLSAALLSKLHLYVATKEGVVYATAANAQ